MKYYLVALFNEDSNSYIESIQKKICKKYKLNYDFPKLCIPLEVLENPDIDKLGPIIEEILKPYKKFKIKLNNGRFFNSTFKSVELKVENEGYIVRLARKLNVTLKKNGYEVKGNVENPQIFIPLINTNYVPKDFNFTSDTLSELDTTKLPTVDKLELWKTINSKKKAVVKSFPFKSF